MSTIRVFITYEAGRWVAESEGKVIGTFKRLRDLNEVLRDTRKKMEGETGGIVNVIKYLQPEDQDKTSF